MNAPRPVAVIGAGPAGLIAAETLAAAGQQVEIFERMPSAGRKFLMAGRGGLNLTHSEPMDRFRTRYGAEADWLAPYLDALTPTALRAWCEGLGIETFTGSSGRVFPVTLKASPLLRRWLQRLAALGVTLRLRHEWLGFDGAGANPLIRMPGGRVEPVEVAATILALGGASWPRLGADGGWRPILEAAGVEVTALRPSNSGWTIPWSPPMARFAGTPLKRIALRLGPDLVRGEAMITAAGLEGGAVYALGRQMRHALEGGAPVTVRLDLRPDLAAPDIAARLASAGGGRAGGASLARTLQRVLRLGGPALTLIREGHDATALAVPARLAAALKAIPLTVTGTSGLDRAISTAGGISRNALDERLMLRARPGVFACGEMLDWDAPTGGYLLQACFATGMAAARGALDFLGRPGVGNTG